MPNVYGEQRFGADGDNADKGRALVRGQRLDVGPREKRLLVSAYQSALFNRYLEQRMKDGLYRTVIMGDVLRKTDSGGLFVTVDPEVDGARLARGEVAPTGPMFGLDVRLPPAESAAGLREAALLVEEGLVLEDFRRVARIAAGARRPIGVPVGDAAADATDDGALRLTFTLPAGAYATVLCAEIMKSSVESILC
jgi:tRNA pseudouridine13 synthase